MVRELKRCSCNRDVNDSNPTVRLTMLRGTILLRVSRWPSGRKWNSVKQRLIVAVPSVSGPKLDLNTQEKDRRQILFLILSKFNRIN